MSEPFDGNNVAKSVCSFDKFNRIHMKFRLVCIHPLFILGFVSLAFSSSSNWNLEMLVFEERGKPEYS